MTSVYTCNKCGKDYRTTNTPITCAVYHSPDQCCHYGEELIVPTEDLKEVDKQ